MPTTSKRVLIPNFKKRGGLVVVAAQDIGTKEILMVAYTDEAGYFETLITGKAVYFSTSRKKRWMKGEESGNVQNVERILVDCDGDAIVYQVRQHGVGACHTKARSCFYRSVVQNTYLMEAPEARRKEKLRLRDVQVCDGVKE